jgi:hypothetical protein
MLPYFYPYFFKEGEWKACRLRQTIKKKKEKILGSKLSLLIKEKEGKNEVLWVYSR